MTYPQTLEYLFSQLPMYHRIGAAAYKADLDNTIKFCDQLGNPQESFRSVHIAGTNGKGSVSHMLASILQESGLKTGLYTSPHLKDFRERIRVNGKMIPRKYVVDFVKKHKTNLEKIHPSFFEWTVGLAFDYFREEKVDIAVVEVGLGGRLDSTNIITPLLSVITNISFDHMQLLGDTLEKIAAEKAGIIKPGVPVVIGETQEETRDIFVEKAKLVGSEICFADDCVALSGWGYSPLRRKGAKELSAKTYDLIPQARFDVEYNRSVLFSNIKSPLAANYQQKNIATVIASCMELIKAGIPLKEENIRSGIEKVIKNTGLKGRWQVLSRSPLTICDTGHNEAGIREVLEQIRMTPLDKLHFVFGVVNDKEVDHLLTMLPKDATYYFCKADIPRGLDQEDLAMKGNAYGLKGKTYPSVRNALEAARENAKVNDLVLVGGSTFVVAEVV